jgi:crotonobetainyl-CoA:carnitine CoA-transferase CaiB-like acyl-CoA transferase
MTDAASGALHGLKVLDLTQMLAGPYCTMILADQGADVVKVEAPEGDGARSMGPFHPDDGARPYGGYFQSINRNKRSIVVDLKDPRGLAVVRRVVESSDVLVENFRFGVLDRLGLGFDAVHALNPQLVYASIRGYGDRPGGLSPRAGWPAFDLSAQALGGFMSITGEPDQPTKSGPGIGDIVPGMMTAVGILTALHQRQATGLGQHVDIAMYDSILALSERIVHQFSYTGIAPGRQGNAHPLLSPFEVVEAADGWLTLASPSDRHWEVLRRAIGTAAVLDPTLDVNEGRIANADVIRSEIGAWARARTRHQIVEELGGDFPVGEVNDAADIAADPHVAARRMIVELEHPGVERRVAVAGTPIKLSGAPTPAFHRAPLLGEHSREILAELGCDAQEIDALVAAGVVREPDGTLSPQA